MPSRGANDTLLRLLEILKIIPREPYGTSVRRILDTLDQVRFPSTPRTVQRDLVTLSQAFPLVSSGKKGEAQRWSWSKEASSVSFPLPSVESLLAIRLVDKYLWRLLPNFVLREFETLLPRMDSLMRRQNEKDLLARWDRNVRFVPSHFQVEPPQVAMDVHATVFAAFSNKSKVAVEYWSSHASTPKRIELSVQGIVYKPPVIYLVASAFRYREVRTYAFHRILTAEQLGTPAIEIPEFDIDDFVSRGGISIAEENPVHACLRADNALVRYLAEVPLAPDQEIASDGDEDSLVRATVLPSKAFLSWLLSVSPYIEVLEPQELRDEVIWSLEKSRERYTLDKRKSA